MPESQPDMKNTRQLDKTLPDKALLPPRKEIAPRLFGLRDAVGLSPKELARAVGVTPEMVLLYESGEEEIPISYLAEVARVCKSDITSLISGGDAHLRAYTVVRSGDGINIDRRKDYNYQTLAGRMSGRSMEPLLVRVPAKNAEEVHYNEHVGQEFIYMLEGRLEIWMEGKPIILLPGDSIYFDARIPHGLRGLDGQEAVLLDVFS